jgi:hypothetical protein
MLRTNINTEKSDFNKIKDPNHIENVWKSIEKNIPIYFQKIIDGDDELEALKKSGAFKVKTSAPDIRKKLSEIFEDGLHNYQKEDGKYKKFFHADSMQEFEDEDDPKAFKSSLSTKVPIILKARNSRAEMMQEWRTRFATSKASDVYAIFFNLITFMNEFTEETSVKDFSEIDDIENLENFVVLNEDDDYNVPGVIGMGIKSSVLYFLNAKYFLCANKNTLFGYYFLSDCDSFRLPSGSNEFIMIRDGRPEMNRKYNQNMLIDQNYWYPYDLFLLYSLRSFRLLKQLCAKYKYNLNEEYRFVHLNTFMAQICNIKSDLITTMTGGDQEDAG